MEVRVDGKTTYVGRLEHGSDLLLSLTEICRRHDVRLGRVQALGAVQKACLRYYDQDARQYRDITLDRHMELTSLLGNVSLVEGEPFVHAHVTLADAEAKAYGGHLGEGTIVFAAEYFLQTYTGAGLERAFDATTGLHLWL